MNNNLSNTHITNTQVMQILYKDLQDTHTEFHNTYTFDFSKGYIKGKEDTIRKIELLLQLLD
ncbi:hypothetical protein [Clostridium botulinum]|uniref:hypothetical protein n=1 Tax=Clostridium botulinum TaxID=1491 RepID=UPI0004B7EE1A|nr:hypothetical protein [Clostridium botulinum]QDY27146.1 hypothetical protein CGQ40_20795 [Clostridium botulinum]